MRIIRGLGVVALLMVAAYAFTSTARAGVPYDTVATELMCQCGCGKVLNACDMPECSVQKKMGEQVRYMIDQGQGKDEIVRYFVSNYGEQVLAAPTKQGFNLTAWLMPFAVIAAGLGFVYLVVDQWVFRKQDSSFAENDGLDDVAPAELDRYEKQLKKELDQYEGGA